jgi:hypothetical protein
LGGLAGRWRQRSIALDIVSLRSTVAALSAQLNWRTRSAQQWLRLQSLSLTQPIWCFSPCPMLR